MGYDDNTPLKGVTGSGLPAEIWREAMKRVHEGVPVKPLPIVLPAPAQVLFEGDVNEVAPLPETNVIPVPAAPRPTNIIDQVLQDIFGGGGEGSNAPAPRAADQ
jgi:membrane peptidoglycan carboxypeptidase